MLRNIQEERETTIRWDDAEKVAHIWTCSPTSIRRFDKLVAEAPEIYKCVKRKDDSAWYEVDAKYISFRKPSTHVYTDEEREAARQHIMQYHASRKE